MSPPPRTIASTSVHWATPPPASLASQTREFLSNLYGELLDLDEVDCIAMTAHELLENVAEYSAEGASRIDVLLEDDNGRTQVRVRTCNSAPPDRLDELQRLVDRIRSTPDPLAVYDELIAGSPFRQGSGLGLARIRAEADMQLECTVHGCIVTIVAQRLVSIRRPSC